MGRIFSTKKEAERRARLSVERKLISAEFPGYAETDGDIRWHRESWVRMWVDESFMVRSPCETMQARRGITDDGQIIWLVQHPMRPRAFHAVGHDPILAFKRASDAWDRCDRLRRRRGDIRVLARNLILGRESFDITIEDAAASPLSAVEVRSFMSRMGLTGKARISGRIAGLMSLIEPQVGFVIWTASERRAERRVARELATQQALA